MPYFSDQYLAFFNDLAENNNKEWFHAHKANYENQVKNPFQAFLIDFIEDIQRIDPFLQTTPPEAMFRINRDIRFSNDKRPYKTHMSAAIVRGGRKTSNPAFYLAAGHDGFWFGGGLYEIAAPQLLTIRRWIAKHPEKFNAVVYNPEFTKTLGGIQGESLKRLPPEFKEVAKKAPFIANKQFYFMKEFASHQLLAENLRKTLEQHILIAKDFYHLCFEMMT